METLLEIAKRIHANNDPNMDEKTWMAVRKWIAQQWGCKYPSALWDQRYRYFKHGVSRDFNAKRVEENLKILKTQAIEGVRIRNQDGEVPSLKRDDVFVHHSALVRGFKIVERVQMDLDIDRVDTPKLFQGLDEFIKKYHASFKVTDVDHADRTDTVNLYLPKHITPEMMKELYDIVKDHVNGKHHDFLGGFEVKRNGKVVPGMKTAPEPRYASSALTLAQKAEIDRRLMNDLGEVWGSRAKRCSWGDEASLGQLCAKKELLDLIYWLAGKEGENPFSIDNQLGEKGRAPYQPIEFIDRSVKKEQTIVKKTTSKTKKKQEDKMSNEEVERLVKKLWKDPTSCTPEEIREMIRGTNCNLGDTLVIDMDNDTQEWKLGVHEQSKSFEAGDKSLIGASEDTKHLVIKGKGRRCDIFGIDVISKDWDDLKLFETRADPKGNHYFRRSWSGDQITGERTQRFVSLRKDLTVDWDDSMVNEDFTDKRYRNGVLTAIYKGDAEGNVVCLNIGKDGKVVGQKTIKRAENAAEDDRVKIAGGMLRRVFKTPEELQQAATLSNEELYAKCPDLKMFEDTLELRADVRDAMFMWAQRYQEERARLGNLIGGEDRIDDLVTRWHALSNEEVFAANRAELRGVVPFAGRIDGRVDDIFEAVKAQAVSSGNSVAVGLASGPITGFFVIPPDPNVSFDYYVKHQKELRWDKKIEAQMAEERKLTETKEEDMVKAKKTTKTSAPKDEVESVFDPVAYTLVHKYFKDGKHVGTETIDLNTGKITRTGVVMDSKNHRLPKESVLTKKALAELKAKTGKKEVVYDVPKAAPKTTASKGATTTAHLVGKNGKVLVDEKGRAIETYTQTVAGTTKTVILNQDDSMTQSYNPKTGVIETVLVEKDAKGKTVKTVEKMYLKTGRKVEYVETVGAGGKKVRSKEVETAMTEKEVATWKAELKKHTRKISNKRGTVSDGLKAKLASMAKEDAAKETVRYETRHLRFPDLTKLTSLKNGVTGVGRYNAEDVSELFARMFDEGGLRDEIRNHPIVNAVVKAYQEKDAAKRDVLMKKLNAMVKTAADVKVAEEIAHEAQYEMPFDVPMIEKDVKVRVVVRPTPVKPKPVKPTPVKPTPVKPTPVKPTPVKPAPVTPPEETLDFDFRRRVITRTVTKGATRRIEEIWLGRHEGEVATRYSHTENLGKDGKWTAVRPSEAALNKIGAALRRDSKLNWAAVDNLTEAMTARYQKMFDDCKAKEDAKKTVTKAKTKVKPVVTYTFDEKLKVVTKVETYATEAGSERVVTEIHVDPKERAGKKGQKRFQRAFTHIEILDKSGKIVEEKLPVSDGLKDKLMAKATKRPTADTGNIDYDNAGHESKMTYLTEGETARYTRMWENRAHYQNRKPTKPTITPVTPVPVPPVPPVPPTPVPVPPVPPTPVPVPPVPPTPPTPDPVPPVPPKPHVIKKPWWKRFANLGLVGLIGLFGLLGLRGSKNGSETPDPVPPPAITNTIPDVPDEPEIKEDEPTPPAAPEIKEEEPTPPAAPEIKEEAPTPPSENNYKGSGYATINSVTYKGVTADTLIAVTAHTLETSRHGTGADRGSGITHNYRDPVVYVRAGVLTGGNLDNLSVICDGIATGQLKVSGGHVRNDFGHLERKIKAIRISDRSGNELSYPTVRELPEGAGAIRVFAHGDRMPKSFQSEAEARQWYNHAAAEQWRKENPGWEKMSQKSGFNYYGGNWQDFLNHGGGR